MITTIVCGVDATSTAASAARTAARIAQVSGARLLIVSAYGKFEEERFSSGDEEFFSTTEKQARNTAEQVLQGLRDAFPEVEITARSADGKPADALVRVAQEESADLIVVGNKRVQGIARVLGSVANDVAAHAHCDVYVAHTHGR